MTMVNVGQIWMPNPVLINSFTGLTTTLDANNELAWNIFQAPKTGNIRNIHFRTSTVTLGDTVDCRIETVDTSNGQPSGTLFGTNTNVSQVILLTDDNTLFRTANLTASAAVTRGDLIAVVIQMPAAAVGNMAIINRGNGPFAAVPAGLSYTGGPLATNKTDGFVPGYGVEYDDGTIYPAAGVPGYFDLLITFTISTSSNPDEVALVFSAPVDMRVIGWCMPAILPVGLTFRISIYESGNNTPILTTTYDTDVCSNTGSRNTSAYFNATVTLQAGTTYYAAFCALSASNITLYSSTRISNSAFDALGLPGAQYAERNRSGTSDPDSASWSLTSTQRLNIALLVDQLDGGGGVGGDDGGGVWYAHVRE